MSEFRNYDIMADYDRVGGRGVPTINGLLPQPTRCMFPAVASRATRNESLEVRKAETEARANALREGGPVVPLVTSVDPDCVRRPLIFDNVHIPEADLEKLEDV